MGFTLTCWPATARATLPHTPVDATTVAARGCAELPQPVRQLPTTTIVDRPTATPTADLRTVGILLTGRPPTTQTNENRFHRTVAQATARRDKVSWPGSFSLRYAVA
jgi:hypothetical protein